MAEIIYQRNKVATIHNVVNQLVILLIITTLFQTCLAQVINRVPHFVPQIGDMSQFSLMENTPVGTPVYQLKGVDPENSQLRYSISGQYFTVDSITGVVTLAKSLDREEQDTLVVIISITDEGVANTEPNTVSLRRIIPVKDINDNPPVFQNRPYIVNISEDLPVGREIELNNKIIITDRDEGINGEIKVICSKDKGGDAEACNTFRIVTDKISPTEFQAHIYLNSPLDYESRSAYVISLVASDVSDKPLKTTASVAVTVSDVQDQPPVFINGPYSATVQENTKPNTIIMDIMARDGDTANPRPVLITLEGDDKEYFTVAGDRGHVTLRTTENPIDREGDAVMLNGGVYTFFIKATELINNEVPSDYTVSQITIIVTDVDDHVPEFNKDVFDITIPENIENGSPIPGLSIYVDDKDIGINSKYDLRLENVFNSEGVFSLSTKKGEGRTPVTIKVKDSTKLDYDVENDEDRSFSFDIIASSNDLDLSRARINIKLLDMNDNAPIFDLSSYKFGVQENATIGSKIGDVYASDKDYGIFGAIEYSLTGFGSNMFTTDATKGGLFVANILDYEKQKSYSLTLLGKDGGGKVSTTSIFVDVLDVNDNAPLFELPEYSRTIRDGASSFEPQFYVRATDADGPTQGGGRIKYSIESDNSIQHNGEVFNIDQETGEITIVERVMTMDTTRGQYEVTVRATDYGEPPLYNETMVYIRVGVPGNQRPTFKGNYHKYTLTHPHTDSADHFSFELNPMNYKASIREDAEPGQNVTKVVASDPDGLDDQLTYHIVSGAKDNFVINEKTGVITVSSDANLDRDLNADKYEIIVSAVDSGIPIPETATTTVLVTIIDVNNKPPKFNNTETQTYISERTKKDTVIRRLPAIDPDLNAKLVYSIIDPVKAFTKAGVQLQNNSLYDYKNLFRINETNGEIIVNNTLDYSQSSLVILSVKVVDVNAESNMEQQFDVIEHTIFIQPYADKNPQFTNPGWTSANNVIHNRIKEEQPIGSTVLILMAEDPLSGHLVSNFKVINSETDLLQVDPTSGQVVLTKHLDYEELSNPNLTITIKATSNDGSKYSISKVIIEVFNINDNAPIFEKQLYKLSILESVKYPEQFLTVKATDADAVLTDEDKVIGYSTVKYSLKGENADLFDLDPDTGVLKVRQNMTLDRERQSVLVLEVEARDTPAGGQQQLKSSAKILIDVLDVNDNAPHFDKDHYTAVVPENVPVGILVTKLTASDPDEGLGGEIQYEVVDQGEAAGLFTIDPATGELSTLLPLTGRGRTQPYTFIISATDGGGLNSAATLTLYIGDVSANDGVPRFITPEPQQMLYVSENATIGSVVFQVVASDPDDPTQPSGQLYYAIQQTNEDAKSFAIDRKSGLISTRKSLDRERQASYRVVIVVSDLGQPPQQSSRLTTILVTDVDDHKPHFSRTQDDGPIVISTPEEIPIDTVIGELEAVDEDTGDNAAIDYQFIAGNELGLFKLERTNESVAVIKAAGRIDREAHARHLLTVKCFKLGTTPKHKKGYNRLDQSEIQVLIKINDIDDHLPEFESANLTIGVRLNVAIDTVITTVKAIDKDPESLPIDYRIVNVTFDSPIKSKNDNNLTEVMSLNNVTGELRIMKNLIHYADGTFRLTIRANNSQDNDRFGDILVEVVIVRARELLRLVWDGSGISRHARSQLSSLKSELASAMLTQGLRLQLYDPTHTAGDMYDSNGACFQFRKSDTGDALTPKAMKAAIREAGASFQEILIRHSVSSVEECGVTRPRHTLSQHALLSLAALLPIAAVIATTVLCCLHSSAIRKTRRAGPRSVPASYMSAPTRLYAEPLYST